MPKKNIEKFPEELRTFKTRVEFIRDIFSNKYSSNTIMAHCIKFKLQNSFENYLQELKSASWTIYGADVMDVIKKID